MGENVLSTPGFSKMESISNETDAKEKLPETPLILNEELKEKENEVTGVETGEKKEKKGEQNKESLLETSKNGHPVVKPGDDVAKWTSRRWIFCYVSLVAMMFVFVVRVGMSVAIVCMVKQTELIEYNNSVTMDPSCSLALQNLNEADMGEFEWSDFFVANILAGFYYGYALTNLLGGFLADKYGGRRVFGYSLLLSGMLLLFYPVLSRVSGYWTLVLRIISGLFSGPFYPAMHSLCGRWAPPVERGRLMAIIYSGPMLGSIFTMTFSGYLCANGFDNGWGSVFYLSGLTAILFSILWFYLVYDCPDTHPRISAKELAFLDKAIQCRNRVKYIPWKRIMTSKAVWAIVVCHFCFNWSIFTLQTVLPLYMKDVLYFDIKSNGFMSSVPYFGQIMSYCFVGILSDFIIHRGYLTVRGARVFFQCMSFFGSACFFVGTGFIDCTNAMVAVCFLFLAGAFIGFSAVGFIVNHVDIAPSYAGLLFGVTNTMSSLPGFIAPILAGALTPNGTQEEWQKVFFTCACFSTLGAIVFAVFSRGDIQEWARHPEDEEIDTEKTDASESKA